MLPEYATLRSLTQRPERRGANVIVLPESTVHHWNAATAAFWQADLDRFTDRKTTVILGAQIHEIGAEEALALRSDIENSVRYLRGESLAPRLRPPWPAMYRNVAVLLDHNATRIIDQHIPVPLAMWRPFTSDGVRLQWGPNRAIPVAGQRVCILICYEALLAWPLLSSLPDQPTLFCVIANDRWVAGTPIPSYREGALKSWSLLFSLPFLRASNN
jgi:hypothetical protein